MKMKMILSMFSALVLAGAVGMAAEEPAAGAATAGVQLKDYWVFAMTNLASPPLLEKILALMQRAHRAGYTGIFLCDSKVEKFQLQDKSYARKWRQFRQACTDEGMQLVVPVCSMGYNAEFLAGDPNLAEGMPVRGAEFVVRDGKLLPSDTTTKLVNGSLAQWKGDVPRGWTVDKPGVVSFRDEQVGWEGKPALRQEHGRAKSGPVRLSQRIAVEPWHYYHLSVMAKTEDCTSGDFRVMAISAGAGPGRVLNWQPPPIRETMDWTRLDVTFCSLDQSAVTIYCGTWGTKAGTVWWSDLRIEPAGLVNVIRRPSLPLSLTSADGQTTYEEGRDFSEVNDPKLGHDPHPGYFTNWHEPPVVTIPAGSRLKEGQTVAASYHISTSVGKPGQINCCLSEPEVYERVEKVIGWVHENVQPDVYMMGYDEIRHCGWDDSCARRHLTCGQILAENVRRCSAIIRQVAPDSPIATWNDMFDPFHLAFKEGVMYLAKGDGPWYGSWEGLPTSVIVLNWRQNNLDSLKFFAGRGQPQILAGYYDQDPARIVEWLKMAAQVKGVRGVMYTTWRNDYSKLEVFIKYARQFSEGQEAK
ncbi:MAG: hypothetical protein ABSF26_22365 [Thermoguttaceae bacterium]